MRYLIIIPTAPYISQRTRELGISTALNDFFPSPCLTEVRIYRLFTTASDRKTRSAWKWILDHVRTSRGKSFLRTEFVPNELRTRSHLSRVGQRTRTYVTIAARFSQQCARSCCNSQPTLHYPASTCLGQRFVLSCCNVFWPAFCTVLLQRVLANVLYYLVTTCFGQHL